MVNGYVHLLIGLYCSLRMRYPSLRSVCHLRSSETMVTALYHVVDVSEPLRCPRRMAVRCRCTAEIATDPCVLSPLKAGDWLCSVLLPHRGDVGSRILLKFRPLSGVPTRHMHPFRRRVAHTPINRTPQNKTGVSFLCQRRSPWYPKYELSATWVSRARGPSMHSGLCIGTAS
ncbi:hypothetical protein BC826DRAFT_128067 [Russula brevipes]|nr:hypothetical protein BC826DRAFT_128067 [Russula brevipes]